MNRLNFHWWDSTTIPATGLFSTVTIARLFGVTGSPQDFPWNVKSRVIGDVIEVAVWLDSDLEPEYGDVAYGGAAVIPPESGLAAAVGQHGVYMGHLAPDWTADLDTLRIYQLTAQTRRGLSRTDDDILDVRGGGQLTGRVSWELRDKERRFVTELHPRQDSAATVEVRAKDEIRRKLTGLALTPTDFDAVHDVGLNAARISPAWVLPGGSRFPLGVFVFSESTRNIATAGDTMQGGLMDQTVILAQKRTSSFTVAAGQSVRARLNALLKEFLGEITWQLDGTIDVHPSIPMLYPAGTTTFKIVSDLFALLNYYPPYFDNVGVLRGRNVPLPLSVAPADHSYIDGPTCRILAGTIAETEDSVKAPNRYLVVDNGPTQQPIVGVYNIPSWWPHSAKNRGYPVVEKVTMQGLQPTAGKTSNAVLRSAAHRAAERAAAVDFSAGFSTITFESTPDPRHDIFDLCAYTQAGAVSVFREAGWALNLGTFKMRHTLVGMY